MAKTGLLLEGGGIRGIFTAGVLDVFIEQKIEIPYVIGVSAGSGNAVNYISGQAGRSKRVITHEGTKSFYGLPTLKDNGKLLDLQRMVDQFAEVDFPYDFDAYLKSEKELDIVVTNCLTGQPEYFNKPLDKEKFYDVCRASCAVQLLCNPVMIDDVPYLDGSISDMIPCQRALDQGCDKLVVIMTRPEKNLPANYMKYRSFINMAYRHYPEIAHALLIRKKQYEAQLKFLKSLEKQGKALVIRPIGQPISNYEVNSEKIQIYYDLGYVVGRAMADEVREFIS